MLALWQCRMGDHPGQQHSMLATTGAGGVVYGSALRPHGTYVFAWNADVADPLLALAYATTRGNGV